MILFTAFEPSGDALAAAMIESLVQRCPQMPVFALGGPRMAAAGATLIESTTEHAKMTGGAVSELLVHRRRVKRLGRWLADHPVQAVIPTDSPAANWSICKAVRKARPEATIVHLVCPQIWAWASWRVRRLQRLSDHVMCVLPFEPAWLGKHQVPATFVGHPLFENGNLRFQISDQQSEARADGEVETDSDRRLPKADGLKLALLPGSRKQEILRNWPTMLSAFERLARQFPGLQGVVAARDPADEAAIAKASGRWPLEASITVRYGMTDEVIDWADAVLAVSGTASLQVAARQTPLVVLYNLGWVSWHLIGWWLIDTRTFSLPNLIGQSMGIGNVVAEFVPHFGQVDPLVDALGPLLSGGEPRRDQLDAFKQIAGRFEHLSFREATVRTLLRVRQLEEPKQ